MLTVKLPRLAAFLFLAVPAFAQYAGPAILSRGEAPSAMNAAQVDFIPFLSLLGIYDTGLAGVSTNSQGQLANVASKGLELDVGISGVHSWRQTKISLNYAGAAREYTPATYYSGIDQSLMLGITQQFSRHVILQLNESAGIFTEPYGLPSLSTTVSFDPSTTYTPTTDFFNNRTIFTGTQVLLTYQRTARLSFSFGGDGALTRYRSNALYGVTAEDANGDMEYRITRHSTIGANYMYTHFSFAGLFSNTDLHRFSGTYAVQFSRTWEFTGFGGVTRAETRFPQVVTVSPVIQALLGITQGYVVSYSLDWLPTYMGRLSKTFTRGVASISGGHTITPGNGLFLTSKTYDALAGYTYTGIRRWSFSLSAGYNRSESIGNIMGEYASTTAGLQTSRQISHVVHAVAGITANKYQSSSFTGYNRLFWDARVGLSFSPRDVPLRFW
ncbi:MAG: hypothetical protein WCB12_00360 [Bryobacteraceae bacterium]